MGRASREKAERARSSSPPSTSPPKETAARPAFESRHLSVLILLAVLAVCIYLHTLSFPFQFDDEGNIIDNLWVHSLSHVLDLSGTRYVGFLTFALNYAAGGLNVFGYHLVNLLIHIANGFLVYLLVLLLFKAADQGRNELRPYARFVPLATALLFVAHPIQTQAVTYIVQRFASLMTLFYLLAVVGYLKWRLGSPETGGRSLRWYGVSLLSCFLAMKTKENSFTLPLMILLVEWIFFRSLREKRWRFLIPYLLMLPVIPLSRGDILGEAEGFARDVRGLSRPEYLFTQFRVIVTYLRLLFLPINQHLDYDYPVYRSLFHPAVFVSFLFLFGLLIIAVRLIGRTGHIRLISFGILWFFLTLSIESSIIPIQDVIFEHRLYLPGMGIFMAVSVAFSEGMAGFGRRGISPRWGLVVMGVVIAVLSAAAWRRNLVWGDAVTLWRDVVEKSPGKARGHYNLGLAYQGRGMFEEAIGAYQKVLTLKPDYTDAYNNLGNIHKAEGRMDEAIEAYQKAISITPGHAEAHNNLGNIYTTEGRLEEAIRLYEKAIELKASYAEAYNNLGIAYTTQGHLDRAIEIYRKGLLLQGDLDRTHFNLGNAFVKKGMMEEAVREYRTAIVLNPNLPDYHFALGNAYTDMGRPNEAIRAYEATVRLKPDFAEGYFALGNATAGQNRLKEAMQSYETALRIYPGFAEVHNNLGNIHMLEGRFEEAVREYRQALKIKPDYSEASRNLGIATEKQGRTR